MFYLPKLPVRLQGNFGTCVSLASANIKDRQEQRNYPNRGIKLSPLFVYTLCKQRDGIPNQEGTYPRIAMQVLKEIGVCQEKTFPYSLMANSLPPVPTVAVQEASTFKIGAYAQTQTLAEIKQAIFRDGAVMGAVIVCSNFVDAKDGYIELPEGTLLGGHAICIDGWNDNLVHGKHKGYLRFVNSWDWGEQGYGYLPYDFVNFRDDLGMPYFREAWSSIDVILPPKEANEVVLWLDKTLAIIDGNEVTLDQPPTLMQNTGRTMVPLRFISEVFNRKVEYFASEKKIVIKKPV